MRFPGLEHCTSTDRERSSEVGDNFGHHSAFVPRAVVEPASVDEVVRLVAAARAQGVTLAAHGRGHATFTHHRADVVVSMRKLGRVGAISGSGSEGSNVWVEAGASWQDVLDATLPLGKAPRTLPDFQQLSVGGTLSVGGVGGESHRHGALVDGVSELEVVTGTGERLRCSSDREPELFAACLAGLGQCALITGARVQLVDVAPDVRSLRSRHGSLGGLMRVLTGLASTSSFHHLYANVTLRAAGAGFEYELVASQYGERAWDATSFRRWLDVELPGHDVIAIDAIDWSFDAFSRRVESYVEAMQRCGTWQMAHPWLDLFLPESVAAPFVQQVLDGLAPEDLGEGGVLLYAIRRDAKGGALPPLLRVPEASTYVLFDVLRNVPIAPKDHVDRALRDNRATYLECRRLGGTLYPIGSTPMSVDDWGEHFGEQHESFRRAKLRFDSDRVLAPGLEVFR